MRALKSPLPQVLQQIGFLNDRISSIVPYTISSAAGSHVAHHPPEGKAHCPGSPHQGAARRRERALASEAACAEVLRQLASARGALTGLTAEVMEDHLREHVVEIDDAGERRKGGDEMIEVIRAYMK